MSLSDPSIEIRFVRGSRPESKLIEWQTRCWCSHVEAMVSSITTLGSMLKGGVKCRSIEDHSYKHVKRCEFWHIPVTSPQETRFYDFLQNQIGKPYDWRAILSFGLGNRDWREPDSWICSELVTAAGEKAGLFTIPAKIPVSRITPRDTYMLFTMLPGATMVEEKIQ